jgi:hypothetical protein
MSRYQVLGHAAPAKASEQHVQAALQVDETPKTRAGETVGGTRGVHRIRQDKLDVRLQVGAGGRPAQRG